MIGCPFLHAAYNPSVKPFGFASSPYSGEPSPAGDGVSLRGSQGAGMCLSSAVPRRGKAKPRGRRGAGVQNLAASESANGGLRGAFRPWYKGPPAAFLSTFRRWKVDAVLRARRRGSFRSSRSIITGSPFLHAAYNPSVRACGPASSPFRSRAFLRKRHCGTAKRAARDLTGGTMFLP